MRPIFLSALCAGILSWPACHATPEVVAPPPRPPPASPAQAPASQPPSDLSAKASGWQRACQNGDMWSCTTLGTFYAIGDDAERVPKDWKAAVGYLEPACTAKVPEACASLIVIYENGGVGVDKDEVRAATLVQQQCAAGWEHYCDRTGP
jgi:TPR repeat protein